MVGKAKRKREEKERPNWMSLDDLDVGWFLSFSLFGLVSSVCLAKKWLVSFVFGIEDEIR